MTYIVNPRNKKEEKVLETILKGLSCYCKSDGKRQKNKTPYP
jgi:hypothetical protein